MLPEIDLTEGNTHHQPQTCWCPPRGPPPPWPPQLSPGWDPGHGQIHRSSGQSRSGSWQLSPVFQTSASPAGLATTRSPALVDRSSLSVQVLHKNDQWTGYGLYVFENIFCKIVHILVECHLVLHHSTYEMHLHCWYNWEFRNLHGLYDHSSCNMSCPYDEENWIKPAATNGMAPFGPWLHVLPDTVLTEGYYKLCRVMAKAGRIMNVQNDWKNPILKIYTPKGSQTSMMWSLRHQITLCTDTTVCTDTTYLSANSNILLVGRTMHVQNEGPNSR